MKPEMQVPELTTEKIHAEIAKLIAETSKINRETSYYPLIVGAIITLAIVAIAKLFL